MIYLGLRLNSLKSKVFLGHVLNLIASHRCLRSISSVSTADPASC